MPAANRRRVLAPMLPALALGVLSSVSAMGQGEAQSLSTSFREAARRVLPAVVTIRPLGGVAGPNPFESLPPGVPFRRGLPQDGPPVEPTGSGVVIDAEKGFVLTNDHLVQGNSAVVVILRDGQERPVSQVRRDPKSDLALLIIDGKGLTAAEWGDSDALDIGDWVLAIGQPFGLSGTVTAGIVSGKGREVGAAMYQDLIQTDAAINPGNSGGPLINLKGQIVGVNTAIKSLRGGYEGVGFAIPASRARRVASDLSASGRVKRAYLGIHINALERQTGERLGQPGAVQINGVTPEGPAADAGLIRGDIVLSVDGKPVNGPGSLQAATEFAPTDRPLTLSIVRDGERKEVRVQPREQPETFGLRETEPPRIPGGRRVPGSPPPVEPPLESGPAPRRARPPVESTPAPAPVPRPDGDDANPRETGFRTADVAFPTLGLRLSEPTPELARRHRLARPEHGLVIVGVDRDGPADRGGLEVGMVVTDLGRRKIENLDDFRAALGAREDRADLVVRILKGTKAEFRVIPLGRDSGDRDAPGTKNEPSSR